MTNTNKPSHTVKIDADLYEQIITQGKYGESFSDILRRILND